MTDPRLYVRNSTYLFTRRCSERRFFLRPGVQTNQTYLYCVARAAAIGDVSIHVATAMSNHHHQSLTDRREGGIADYAEWLHGQLGRAINSSLGRWEGFLTPTPAEVTLTFEKPPGFDAYTDREFDQYLRHEVTEEQHRLNRERRKKGLRVLGRAHVLKQNPFGSPNTSAPRRQLNPLVASKCPKRRRRRAPKSRFPPLLQLQIEEFSDEIGRNNSPFGPFR